MSLIFWPDVRLSQAAAPVEHGERCREIIEAMFKVLESSGNGVGLAAPQIGIMKRIIVCRVPLMHRAGVSIVKHAIINPVVSETHGTLVMGWEGCLSFPDKQVLIPRYPRIRVDGFTMRWEPITVGAKGLVARVLLHEIDHLNGRTIADYARYAHEIEQKQRQEQQHELPLGGPG